jgi:hypothetical protein
MAIGDNGGDQKPAAARALPQRLLSTARPLRGRVRERGCGMLGGCGGHPTTRTAADSSGPRASPQPARSAYCVEHPGGVPRTPETGPVSAVSRLLQAPAAPET